jgi:hypothetical protein
LQGCLVCSLLACLHACVCTRAVAAPLVCSLDLYSLPCHFSSINVLAVSQLAWQGKECVCVWACAPG